MSMLIRPLLFRKHRTTSHQTLLTALIGGRVSLRMCIHGNSKCKLRKRLKNSGMSYVSRNGVTRRPKLLVVESNAAGGVTSEYLLSSVKTFLLLFRSLEIFIYRDSFLSIM